MESRRSSAPGPKADVGCRLVKVRYDPTRTSVVRENERGGSEKSFRSGYKVEPLSRAG